VIDFNSYHAISLVSVTVLAGIAGVFFSLADLKGIRSVILSAVCGMAVGAGIWGFMYSMFKLMPNSSRQQIGSVEKANP
jgi:hypothetical protein